MYQAKQTVQTLAWLPTTMPDGTPFKHIYAGSHTVSFTRPDVNVVPEATDFGALYRYKSPAIRQMMTSECTPSTTPPCRITRTLLVKFLKLVPRLRKGIKQLVCIDLKVIDCGVLSNALVTIYGVLEQLKGKRGCNPDKYWASQQGMRAREWASANHET